MHWDANLKACEEGNVEIVDISVARDGDVVWDIEAMGEIDQASIRALARNGLDTYEFGGYLLARDIDDQLASGWE
jgi:hypothetical protein